MAFKEAEQILDNELKKVDEYFKYARLTQNHALNLNNKQAQRKLNDIFYSNNFFLGLLEPNIKESCRSIVTICST